MNNTIPYPHVYRIQTDEALGVKTYVNGAQYGNSISLENLPPDLSKEAWLVWAENEIREVVESA